jgi:FkbM family methyltransferase
MRFLRRAVRPLLVGLFVSRGPTRIRRGSLRGRYLPPAVARRNLPMIFGAYEPEICAVLREQARDARVVYDIGAHVGYMSLLLADVAAAGGKVIAFEPSPREADAVEGLIRCNGLEGRVTLERCAVSDADGEATFIVSDKSFTGILDSAPESRHEGDAAVVPTVTLDGFVFGRGNPAPDFIKLDVESAEAMVIAGATRLLREVRPKMLIELHGPDAARDTIRQMLEHGYRLQRVGDGPPVSVTTPDQLRPVFVRNRWTCHVLASPPAA